MWILLVIVVGTWFLPRYNQLFFILKHTITFLFLGLFTVKLNLRLFKRDLDKEELNERKILILRGFTILSITASLLIISIGQREYILEAETPPVQRCYYYDEFGNYIHGSRFVFNCPTPEILEKTDTTLSMSFEYMYYGSGNGYSGSSSNGVSNYTYRKVDQGASKIQVDIEYTSNHIIQSYRLREVTNYLADDYSKDESESDFNKAFTLVNQTMITNYYEVVIDTEFNDGEIYQNKKIYRSHNTIDIVDDVKDLTFKTFDVDESTYEIEFEVEYNHIEEGIYQFVIYQNIPARDIYAETPTYEGKIEPVIFGRNIYLENEQAYDGDLTFSSLIYNYTIDLTEDTSSFIENRYGSITDYNYENLKDSLLPITVGVKNISYHNNQNEESISFDFNKYNNFYHVESRYVDYLIYSTNYGYRIEQYGSDGVKNDSELSSTIGEIEASNSGIDDSILGLDNQSHLFYDDAPIFDYNAIIKYLLQLP